uniref:AlNc14C202G8710 protein n=1 Tax=Albugo laibachii Nc14 TaxID=890382 RepID=F0WQQ0_9STRA|nr:AlNc14C202G8710 [Albugo laibachii Nc14]|eukprot:CCA23659.1 AlNc14C202G8710 [Albugo laibachii Nc14]
MSTKRVEISHSVRLEERCTTLYNQVIDPPTAILHSPVPVDDDDRPTNMFIGNLELQFMAIDQVGHPHRADQLAIPGTSDLQRFSLDAVDADTSLMDIDNSPTRDQLALHPDQLTAHRFSASIAPRRRQRTVQESNLRDAIVPYPDVTLVNHGDDDSRETKRMRIMSEKANAAIESPATYEEDWKVVTRLIGKVQLLQNFNLWQKSKLGK